MKKGAPRVLVVGWRDGYRRVFDGLETNGYLLDYVAEPTRVKGYLKQRPPSAVLLALPPGRQAAEESLAWLEPLKERSAVIVISCWDAIPFYVATMERGAFDFITCRTPLPEITRVLENAIRWHQLQAA